MAKPNNSLVTKKPQFSQFLCQDSIRKKINDIVGGSGGQRFVTAIISAVSTNIKLAECDHGTILSSALLGESLNLSPSPQLGQYYIIPFGKVNPKATFVLGYKGYIQLAIRSGYYKKINVIALKKGELVKYDPLNEEIKVNLIENEDEREQAETTGYFAMFEYHNGFQKTLYWSKTKMENHADNFSKAFYLDTYKLLLAGKIPESDLWKYSSFWYKDFDSMAYKTMLRQIISKWGIMSIELQTAIVKDNAVLDADLNPHFLPDVQEEPQQVYDAETGEVEKEVLEEKEEVPVDEDPMNNF